MYGVILAGGSGTRFWPLSRKKIPKQFLKLFNERTLLEDTIQRLTPLIPGERIIIVTTAEYREKVKEIVKDVPEENIIIEPAGRNTAPAIALAAFRLKDKKDEVMGVFPSDHLILDESKFRKVLNVASDLAKSSGCLITLGMKPDRPETGYGYIELGKFFDKRRDINIFQVRRFVEKPDLRRAKLFLRRGNFMWNSGMFVWRIDVFLEELRKHLPDIYSGIQRGVRFNKNGVFEIDSKVYQSLSGISVDYGIMEKSDRTLVIPADIGWSDLGSWSTLAGVLKQDENGNVVVADGIYMQGVKNSLFYAKDKFIAGIGIEDLVVVSSGNAILICKKSNSQEVRNVVEFLSRENKEDLL